MLKAAIHRLQQPGGLKGRGAAICMLVIGEHPTGPRGGTSGIFIDGVVVYSGNKNFSEQIMEDLPPAFFFYWRKKLGVQISTRSLNWLTNNKCWETATGNILERAMKLINFSPYHKKLIRANALQHRVVNSVKGS